MNQANGKASARRPLKSREWPAFQRAARFLGAAGATPNTISLFGLAAGIFAGVFLAATPHLPEAWTFAAWLLAALCVQLRLAANLLDGMVAVEGGKGGPLGPIFNEVPDRLSDAAGFIGAGYALGGCPELGFTAALLAVMTAYLRAFGSSVGCGEIFVGPGAKQQRMFLLTIGCLWSGLAPKTLQPAFGTMTLVLWLVIGLAAVTCIRRLVITGRILRGFPRQ